MDVALDVGESLAHTPNTLGKAIRRFARAPTAIMLVVVFATTAAYRASLGPFGPHELLIPIAIIAFWPFQEWLIHVFILHFRPRKIGRLTIDLPVAKKHRNHHLHPWDIDEGFMPLHAVMLSMPVLYGLWFYFAPSKEIAATGTATWVLFSLHYEWVHFIVHTRYRPKLAVYERMWRNHRLHHCKNEKYWMGVSTQLGDKVLGTSPDPKATETSKTCRTLGIDTSGFVATKA
jgi:hypothetical protein